MQRLNEKSKKKIKFRGSKAEVNGIAGDRLVFSWILSAQGPGMRSSRSPFFPLVCQEIQCQNAAGDQADVLMNAVGQRDDACEGVAERDGEYRPGKLPVRQQEDGQREQRGRAGGQPEGECPGKTPPPGDL